MSRISRVEEDLTWLLRLPCHKFWSQIQFDQTIQVYLIIYFFAIPFIFKSWPLQRQSILVPDTVRPIHSGLVNYLFFSQYLLHIFIQVLLIIYFFAIPFIFMSLTVQRQSNYYKLFKFIFINNITLILNIIKTFIKHISIMHRGSKVQILKQKVPLIDITKTV